MKNSKKRGFTIVELVIVIAVIAILAGVLIPTFASVIKKANEASDTALIKSLNTSLKADEVLSSKPATMHDALQVVKNDGYDLTKIKATASGNEILWDSENNCFVYLKDDQINYIPDSYDQAQSGAKLWKIVAATDALDETYSNYLAKGRIGNVAAKTGVDVGDNTDIASVAYEGKASAQSVVIRTNGGKLTVNAASDTVNHYGQAKSVDVVSCANESYHEHGKVGFLQVTSGRVAVEHSAEVVTLYVAASTAKVDNNFGTVENAYVATGISNSGNLQVVNLPDGKSVEDVKQEAENKHSAVAIVDGAYQTSLEAAFAKALTMVDATIDIIKDIDMSNISWKPIDLGKLGGDINTTCTKLTINGNNHTITGFNAHVTSTNDPKGEIGAGYSNYYGEGLFGRIGKNASLNVFDLTFDNAVIDDTRMSITPSVHTSQVAVVVGISSGTTTLRNVSVKNSYVYGGEKVAALIGHNTGVTTIENCSVINSTIVGHQCYIAPVVAFANASVKVVNVRLSNNVSKVEIRDGADSPIDVITVDIGNTLATWGNNNWYAGSAIFMIKDDGTLITNYTKSGEYYSYN